MAAVIEKLSFLFFLKFAVICSDHVNLPVSHLPFYFNLFPEQLEECHADPHCPFKNLSVSSLPCWGHEDGCPPGKSFSRPVCAGSHKGWVRSKEEQIDAFYEQADFGYVRSHRNSIQVMCEPTFLRDSALECSDHLQFCRGRNIFLNLTRLADMNPWRYSMDVLQVGDIAGFCQVHMDRFEKRSERMSPLQSWAPELRNFRLLPKILDPANDCDIYFERPVFILKIDAAVNMYHHFCDFFNLYASLFVNASHPTAFSTDVDIIIWETYPYRSVFQDMWSAFSHNPVRTADYYAGKTVCFRNLVLPLLPRMIFGLYYNTPLVYGCEKSGLFKAFSQHILHRLQIPTRLENNVIRVTFLSRETSYRNVVNEKELLKAIAAEPGVQVSRVVFDATLSFKKQLTIVQSTDIFIGMHGAGLTHLLFLPDWAAVFELYNCEDESCYFDLARLRGIKYATWQKKEKITTHGSAKHPDGNFHAKFANYSFDVEEFISILQQLIEHVRNKKGTPSKTHDEL